MKIVLTTADTGTRVEVVGVNGPSCKDIVDSLHLGEVTESEATDEYWATVGEEDVVQNQNGD